jgi:predicted TIM-barrel enzyme
MVHDLQAIPEVIVLDGSGEQTGVKWKDEINLIRTRHHLTEHASPWQNRAERKIGEIKRGIKRATRRSGSPKRL